MRERKGEAEEEWVSEKKGRRWREGGRKEVQVQREFEMREKGCDEVGEAREEGWRWHEGGERQMGGGESKSLLAHTDLTLDNV